MERTVLRHLGKQRYLDVIDLLPGSDLDLTIRPENTTLRYELLLLLPDLPEELRPYLDEPVSFDVLESYVVRATIEYPENVLEITTWFISQNADLHIVTKCCKTLYYRLLEDYTRRPRRGRRVERDFELILQEEIPLDLYYLYLEWAGNDPKVMTTLSRQVDEVQGLVRPDALTLFLYPKLLQNGMYDEIIDLMNTRLNFLETEFNLETASPEAIVDFLHLVVNPVYREYFVGQQDQLLDRLLSLISAREIEVPPDLFRLSAKKEVVIKVLESQGEVPKDYVEKLDYNLAEIEDLIKSFPQAVTTFEDKIRYLRLVREKVNRYRESLYRAPTGTFFRKASQNYSRRTADPWEEEVVSPDRSWLL